MKKFAALCSGLILMFTGNLAHAIDRLWIGPPSADWSNPNNWSPTGFPGPGDRALIDSGSVNVNADVTLDALTLSGGSIGGTSAIITVNSFTWTGGTVGGTGSLVVATGGQLSIIGNAIKYLSTRSLVNGGTGSWSGSGALYLSSGARFENTGAFTVQNDATVFWYTGSASPLFINTGTFTKNPAAGTATFSGVSFSNGGVVQVQTGTLDLAGGGTNSGTFAVSGGATLNFSTGTHLLLPSCGLVGAGVVQVPFGSTIFQSTNVAVPMLNVTGSGTAYFQTNLALGVLNVSGTAHFNASSSIATFNLTNGVVGGTNAATIAANNFGWSGGTLGGLGSLVVPAGGQLALSGSAIKSLATRNLINGGTGVWSGSGALYLSSGARFENTGAFTVQNDATVLWSTGGALPLFVNSGTFTKNPGTGATTFSGVSFSNGGLVQVQTGALELAGGGTNSGTFAVSGGATLNFSSGTHLLLPSSGLVGAGVVQVPFGSTIFQSTNVAVPMLNVTGSGTAYFQTNLALGVLNVSGTAHFNASSSIATFNLTNGVVGGTNAATIAANNFGWSGGTLGGLGSLVVPAGGQLALSGSAIKSLATRNLINGGTGVWSGSGAFYLSSGARFENNGAFTAQNDATVFWSTGAASPLFVNNGTFTKNPGTGTTAFSGVPFNNGGLVQAQTGALELAGGGTNSGTFAVSGGATLNFSSGTHLLLPSSGLVGAGVVQVPFGSTIFQSTNMAVPMLNVTGSGTAYFQTNLALGVLKVSGTAHFNASSSVATFNLTNGVVGGTNAATIVANNFGWSGGTLGGLGSLVVPAGGQLALSGSAIKSLSTRNLINGGTGVWSGSGAFYLSSGARFENNGAFTAQNDATVLWSTGAASPLFVNNGTFTKNPGTGTTAFSGVPFNNGGLVQAQSGALELAGGGTNSGTFAVSGGATLNFSSGTHLLLPSSGLVGAGVVQVPFGSTIFQSTNMAVPMLNVTGSGTAYFQTNLALGVLNVSGTAHFNASSTVATFNLNNGVVGGTNAATIAAGNFGWIGGTLGGLGSLVVPAGGQLALSGSAIKSLSTRSLINGGTGVWSGSGAFYLSSGARFENNGAFTAQNDATVLWSTGAASPLFVNNGTFTKNPGTGTTAFSGVPFNNGGLVQAQTGALELAGGGTNSGTFAVSGGATLNFSSGTHLLLPSSGLVGAGVVQVPFGSTIFQSTNMAVPMLNVAGSGTAYFQTNLALGVLNVSGTAHFNASSTVATFNLNNGVVGGTNAATIAAGNFGWSGGTLGGLGSLVVPAGGQMTLSGSAVKSLSTRSLINGGTGVWSGSGAFYLSSGARFENNGAFTAQNDATVLWSTGAASPLFVNTGTFTKFPGGGNTTFSGVPFRNQGVLSAQSGTLNFSGETFRQTAGRAELSGGSLAGGTLHLDGGLLTGTGAINGNLENGGTINPGFGFGTITVNGNYLQQGRLDLEIGGLTPNTQHDRLNVTGTARLGGWLAVCLSPGFNPANGDTFQVLSYGSRIGNFARSSGLDLGGGKVLSPDFRASTLALVTTNGPVNNLTVTVAPCPDGKYETRFTGTPGATYTLQATTNLVNWTPLFTTNTPTGVLVFVDAEAASFPYRFYRVCQAP